MCIKRKFARKRKNRFVQLTRLERQLKKSEYAAKRPESLANTTKVTRERLFRVIKRNKVDDLENTQDKSRQVAQTFLYKNVQQLEAIERGTKANYCGIRQFYQACV